MQLYCYCLLTVLLIIEICYLCGRPNMRGNTTVSEQLKQENIAIITVLSSNSTRSQYKTALDSIECYAIQNNYTFMELNGKDYSFICEQKDITFQRHCIVAEILKRNNFTWILFVDSDIGVVHEKRKLEEFIKQDADLIFYERFFNFEVMAGSYFAKKSTFAIRFLRGWADYEFRLPRNFHGRDNGAIHMWLIEVLVPNAPLTPVCWELWRNTTSFETLTRYTLCCREALKNSTAQEVFIYDKGNGWARDSWLTNSYWNPERDFMFHSRKEIDKMKFVSTNNRSLEGPEFSPWFDTLRSPLNLAMCREGKSIWSHEPALIATREELERHLNMKKQLVLEEYENKLEFINRKR